MEPVWEVSEERRSRPNCLRKVLLCGGLGGATLWVRNLGVDGSNTAKTRGGTREINAAGERDKGSKDGDVDLENREYI